MSGAAGWVDLEDRDSDLTLLNGDECDSVSLTAKPSPNGSLTLQRIDQSQYDIFGAWEERLGSIVCAC